MGPVMGVRRGVGGRNVGPWVVSISQRGLAREKVTKNRLQSRTKGFAINCK